jgi:hypothetical protein
VRLAAAFSAQRLAAATESKIPNNGISDFIRGGKPPHSNITASPSGFGTLAIFLIPDRHESRLSDLVPIKKYFAWIAPTAKKDVLDHNRYGMTRVDYNHDGVVNSDDLKLMENNADPSDLNNGKARCGNIQKGDPSKCVVCDDVLGNIIENCL